MIELSHFREEEFNYPDEMDQTFLYFLDAVRIRADMPFYLTSDGRTVKTNDAVRGSKNSLHVFTEVFRASAVDFVTDGCKARNAQVYYSELWRITESVVLVKSTLARKVQLELVKGPNDWHVHLGLYPDGWKGPDKIILATT